MIVNLFACFSAQGKAGRENRTCAQHTVSGDPKTRVSAVIIRYFLLALQPCGANTRWARLPGNQQPGLTNSTHHPAPGGKTNGRKDSQQQWAIAGLQNAPARGKRFGRAANSRGRR